MTSSNQNLVRFQLIGPTYKHWKEGGGVRRWWVVEKSRLSEFSYEIFMKHFGHIYPNQYLAYRFSIVNSRRISNSKGADDFHSLAIEIDISSRCLQRPRGPRALLNCHYFTSSATEIPLVGGTWWRTRVVATHLNVKKKVDTSTDGVKGERDPLIRAPTCLAGTDPLMS